MPDEYIRRKAAVKALFAPGMCYAPMQLQIIKDLPAANVAEVAQGHWIMHNDDFGLTCECSHCHIETMGDSEYCLHCGARMDGGSE